MGAATQTKKFAAHIGDWTRASIMKYSMNNTKLWYRKMSKTLRTSRIRAVVRAAYRRVQEEGNDDERDHELYREHEDERAPEAQSKKEKAEKAAEKKVSSGNFLSTNSLVLQAENIASWKKPRIIEYLSALQQLQTATTNYGKDKRTNVSGNKPELLKNLIELLGEIVEKNTIDECQHNTSEGFWCRTCKGVYVPAPLEQTAAPVPSPEPEFQAESAPTPSSPTAPVTTPVPVDSARKKKPRDTPETPPLLHQPLERSGKRARKLSKKANEAAG